MRKHIAAGNWKMNTSLQEGVQLASEVIHMAEDEIIDQTEVILIPPFTHLTSILNQIGSSTKVTIGAQNCSAAESGAYTGEVSAGMLKGMGVKYVVIGHSERREIFGETNEMLKEKVQMALSNHLQPIFCCGESLDTRNEGKHFTWVEKQISESLFNLEGSDFEQIVIAYEPIWAIGTGVTASSDQAQEMHAHIRRFISTKFGKDVADNLSILYGGSVKPGNAKELFACSDVDGGLVGGASLDSRGFIDISRSF